MAGEEDDNEMQDVRDAGTLHMLIELSVILLPVKMPTLRKPN